MTISVTLVNTSTGTFETLIDKVNELSNLVSNSVVTANATASGSTTTGNSAITGTFSVTTLVAATALRGGTVSTPGPLTISSNIIVTGVTQDFGNSTVNTVINSVSITLANSTSSIAITKPTASQAVSGDYYLSSSGVWGQLSTPQTNTVTSGATAHLIDSWLLADYYGMEYILAVNDLSANNRQISKLLCIQDEGDAYITEYGVAESNSVMGVYTANSNTTHTRAYYTPVSTSTTVYLKRTPISK